MTTATIHTEVEGGDFRPIISADAMADLAAAFRRWVDAGKPDYIPAAEE